MKHITIILAIFILTFDMVFSQKADRFYVYLNASMKALPILGYGQRNVGGTNEIIVGGNPPVLIDPHYEWKRIRGFARGLGIGLGMNIPFYRSDSWSIGTKIGGEASFLVGVKPVLEGEKFIAYTLPNVSLYYRKQWDNVDISFLMGYQRTKNFYVPYNVATAGIMLHSGGIGGIGIYSSLFRQKYYWRTTLGEDRLALKIGEVGLNFTVNFVRKNRD